MIGIGRLLGFGLALILAATGPIELVPLHGPEGQQILINPRQITTLRSPSADDLGHFAPGTHCVIVMTSGKFVPLREDCDSIRNSITLLPP